MLAKRNRSIAKNGKKGGGRRPLVSLLIVAILIVAVFFILEKLKKPAPKKPAALPPPVAHKKPQVKISKPLVIHKQYSAAAKPPPPEKYPEVKPPANLPPIGRGTVAIIIDDMGSSVREVEELMAIDVPLTFSIIPGLGKDREVAEVARQRSYEVMIHVPMEPRDYPQRRLEKNGLLTAESNAEIHGQVSEYLRDVPFAVGANNHMGSRFTEDAEKMQAALTPLSGRGFYFVDSMTTPKSVGTKVAKGLGMRTASRNVFLDNTQDVDAIRKQIRQLAQLASKRGSAIGICHPHKATIQALAAELPVLHKQGITFVYASKLAR